MTDITDRIKEAMVSYEKLKGPFDLRFAKEALADDARTLLPEAIEEIKRLEAKLAVAVVALEKASRDVNWQRNSGTRLSLFVFDYIDAALAEIGEKP